METRNRNILLTSAFALSLVIAYLGASGITQSVSSAVCQEQRKICHGVPTGENCIGKVEYSTKIVPEARCTSKADITERCNIAGEEICSINEQDIGTGWSSEVKVFGQTCETWDQKYSLNLTSC